MKAFLLRLTSRKFLLTIGLIVAVTLFPDLPDSVIYLALSYIGAEGLRDVVAAYRAGDVDKAALDLKRAKVAMGWASTEVNDDNTAVRSPGIEPGKASE